MPSVGYAITISELNATVAMELEPHKQLLFYLKVYLFVSDRLHCFGLLFYYVLSFFLLLLSFQV